MSEELNFQNSSVDRLPPQIIEAEEAVLGGILLDPEAISRVSDRLQPEAFYISAHKEIYHATLNLHRQGKPTDLLSVTSWLSDHDLLTRVGGRNKLASLIESTVSAVNIDALAQLIVDKYQRRRLIKAGNEIVQLGYETETDISKVIDQAEQKVFNIAQDRSNSGLVHISDSLISNFKDIENRNQGIALPGISSGYYDLDAMINGGFQRSDLVIIAGRPAMGKCVAYDTEILLADGSISSIEEIYHRQKANLITLGDNWKFKIAQPSAYVDDGYKPVFRVTTRLGRYVETTITHPYLTINGWRPLSELKVGDKVAVPRKYNVFGTEIIPDSEVKLLVDFINGGAETIPSIVFKLTRAQIALFLNRLFATNGWALSGQTQLGYCSVSEKIARQIQHLLLRFGIIAALKIKSVKYQETCREAWQLDVIDANSIKTFASEIGIFGKPKVISNTEFANSDVYWDEIVSIEPMGEKQVYDLTIPETHNFVANDICVHNTSFSINIAHYIAGSMRMPVAIFSLEMSKEQLALRMLSSEARIESTYLRSGRISQNQWEDLTRGISLLQDMPIYIDDTPGITVTEMRSQARRLQAEAGADLGLILIDYLQLMEGAGDNRVQELSKITRNIKGLARELNVPVIALSQLSRGVESRTNKRPMLSDLRESGCLTGDSLVTLADTGMQAPIRELASKSGFAVWALNEATMKLERAIVSNAFCTGVKPVFKLTTRLGRTIRATGNHKFLTIEGWCRLDELEPSSRIALPRHLPNCSLEQSISSAKIALLGHLIGDGCTLPKHVIQYTTRERDLANTVANLATEAFGELIVPRINQERGWYQVYLTAGYHLTHNVRNPIAEWLNSLSIFGLRSYEKFVPHQIFTQPKDAIALFLRHLWSTDGCIQPIKGKCVYPAIYYTSSSERLSRDVQLLLLTFGINARLSIVPQINKGRDQYQVWVSGKSEIEKFAEMIGAVGNYKQQALMDISENIAVRPANTNRDVIPFHVWKIYAVPAMQLYRITTRQMQAELGNAYCGTGLYKQNISRDRAARLAAVVKCDNLARLSVSDVYWDEIISIEPDGETDVYDLTVPGLHNFVVNGIIAHNSIEQDADLVMMLYRDEYYSPDTPERGLAEVIVAKHRHGPTGTIKLLFDPQFTQFKNLARGSY